MSSFVDLTGQTFGRWSVVSYWGKKKETLYWNCVCSCSNKTNRVVAGGSLKRGISKSCGCLIREAARNKLKDLTNKRYGRLTVVSFNGRKNGMSYWNCVCDCKNELIVIGDNLRTGNTKSCGCYNDEKIHETLEIAGNKYGKLKVIKFYEMRKGESFWLCVCDCENKTEIIVRGSSLKYGGTKSCGCLSESHMANELKIYFKKYYNSISEYRVLKNPTTGHWLPYDIYLKDYKIFIEVNGKQHYSFMEKWWHKTIENFEKSKKRDAIKKKFAKKNGIYIEIDLRKIKTPEEAISYIESFM